MKRHLLKKVAAVGALTSLLAMQASAELPPEVATEIATVSADIATAGGLVIGLAVVAMGVRWVKATFF